MMILFLTNMQLPVHKTFTDRLESCGLLEDYCEVFSSCLNSHSDGTHSLQRIHWWASDRMQHFSKSVPMKKQTHLHLGSRVNIFLFIWAAFSPQAPLHFCLILVRLLISSVVESSHLHANFHVWEVSEGHLSGDKLPEQHCKTPHVRRAPVNLLWLLLQGWEEKRYQWIKISCLRCGHCSANFCR